MRSKFGPDRRNRIDEIITQLKAGQAIAYCCLKQWQYDQVREVVVVALKQMNLDPNLINNFVCMLPANSSENTNE